MDRIVFRVTLFLFLCVFVATADTAPALPDLEQVVRLGPGWTGELAAQVAQSYAGWDVEIGDADNDGRNEILTTGCPDSCLHLFKKTPEGAWTTTLLAKNLAEHTPGMGLSVRVADLNGDGRNEMVLGTGQEGAGTAFFYVLATDGKTLTRRTACRPEHCNSSGYTHSFGIHDLDGDGLKEVLAAYCGGGEIIRYDVDAALDRVDARKIHHLSGSGEETILADVDNEGALELIVANGFRPGAARAEIFEFDPQGELTTEPRLVVEGYEGNPCFYVSILVGDVDSDGKNEMVLGWKKEQKTNLATLIAYRVGETVEPAYVFEKDTPDLDMAYFEKMMTVADLDKDGRNELFVSTRGDHASEFITSEHLGHVFRYEIQQNGAVTRELVADFNADYAESSWLAVGDADNDGIDDLVLATGKGDRTLPGVSYVIVLHEHGVREKRAAN
ncbi:MAG: hypothetical protein GXY07_18410 [Candidatus Hydrogenedentes bacterium]|nr:hypothetical protein [Candidatus Hydrogenedentota bacterium]